MRVEGIPLPPVRDDLQEFEKMAKPSIKVLVRLECSDERVQDRHIGQYIHGVGEWQVPWVSGWVKVAEWWPLPECGTGHKV